MPEINVSFIPDDHGVDSLARQIRVTGRAYPLFEIALMVLAKPERHSVTFSVKRKPDNSIIQPLFSCALDDSLWLSEDEAVRHVLERQFAMFYQADKTQIDPPKGVYTFVAQCGLSGTILGPPNYHDYQNQLRKLHAERFARMPFEAFKYRVRIVKDEAVVKKWIEDQSWKTEYVCLNVAEPLRLANREDVEKHFRQVHAGNIIKAVDTIRLSGAQARGLRDRDLQRLVRVRWEDQQRFPIQVATVLSQQFAGRGLQFFKINKTVTHVAVARPHHLDLDATPISDNIRHIVEYITAHPKCTHRQLLKALAPAPAPTVVPVPTPAPPPPPVEATPESAPAIEGAEGTSGAEAPAAAPAPAPVAEPVPTPELTPEMAAVMTDLHWLIHQGHVIEFANGVLEAAKKPVVKPPRPTPKPSADAGTTTTATTDASAAAITPAPATTATDEAGDAMTPAEMVASESPPSATDVPAPEASTTPEAPAADPADPADPAGPPEPRHPGAPEPT